MKYSACAECEIIHFVNCEILLPQVAMWNEICPHSRSEYFTRRRRISHFAEIFHLPARANFVEKSTCLRKCFFLAEGVGFEPTWGVNPKRFSRSLPKNTVSAQFGAVCAKTIPENPYFTRLFGTVWNRYELKRIDRNRYSPLVFWGIFCTLERIWREFAREELQLQYIEIFLFLERIFHDLGENFLCVTI